MVTVTKATPHVVTWRVGNSLHIESTREAVDGWIVEAITTGRVVVDGLVLTSRDLAHMLTAFDDAEAQEAYDVRLEKVLDRAEQWGQP